MRSAFARLRTALALGITCAAFAAAGCSSNDTTRLNVVVDVDAALALDTIVVDLAGGGRTPLEKTFAASAATGTPPEIRWEVTVSNPPASFQATVTASGLRQSSSVPVVTAAKYAWVTRGTQSDVSLSLASACAGVSCPSGQTCAGGTCGPIPTIGQSPGGSAGGTGGYAGATGLSGQAGSGGSGGGPGVGGIGAGGAAGASAQAGNGHPCSTGADCASGSCAQGVCCDQPCTDSCHACLNALTGSSPDGTCAVVSSGLDDPANACPAGTAATCGNTGHCDGMGGCEKFGSSTVCKTASCGAAGFTAASTCDGKGSCVAGATTDCQGFTCSASTGCATTCAADGDCSGGYCTSAKVCAATLSDGAACTQSDQCTHGNCVSGVCCGTSCSGTCRTCATGVCKPVAAGGASNGACAAGTSVCGHDGTCDGNGGCRYATATVSCGTASCSNGQLTPAGTCNGAGACSTATAGACPGGVVCASTTACKASTCTADADCATGLCQGGTCTAKKGSGSACSAADQCATGYCSDGVCCDSACGGTCQACNDTSNGHTVGTCANISGSPRSGHGSCSGSGTCASACTGGSPACTFPGSSTSCRSPSCTGGTETLAAGCDGAGNCPTAATQPCGAFLCGATACNASCTSNSQCVSGAACVNGVCSVCATGQAVCSNACANLNSDGANCGACGHSCLGGTCTNGTCSAVIMATLPLADSYLAIAANSTTVFLLANASGGTAIFGIPKTSQGISATPIGTYTTGYGQAGYFGASDSLVIAYGFNTPMYVETGSVFSCAPGNCQSTLQTWFSTTNSKVACDPASQECYVQSEGETGVKYAKQGSASQTTPVAFSPVVNMAYGTSFLGTINQPTGISVATGGYLYAAGIYPTTVNTSLPVLQRVAEDGTGSLSTLANYMSTTGAAVFDPVVTPTRVYALVLASTVGIVSIPLPNGVGTAAISYLPGIDVGSNVFFWGDDNGVVFETTASQWASCPATGCSGSPTILADASQSGISNFGGAAPLTGDAQGIYWVNVTVDPNTFAVTSAQLMKVAR